jgi:hypothetical protein
VGVPFCHIDKAHPGSRRTGVALQHEGRQPLACSKRGISTAARFRGSLLAANYKQPNSADITPRDVPDRSGGTRRTVS